MNRTSNKCVSGFSSPEVEKSMNVPVSVRIKTGSRNESVPGRAMRVNKMNSAATEKPTERAEPEHRASAVPGAAKEG